MRETDFDEFGAMLDAVCGLLSRGAYVPSATNTALWFRALAAHDLDAVRAGFDAHVKDRQRGRFVPTPADVLAQIDGLAADDGRPGAEEAWATALRARDEAETVVWTAEMAGAWNVARSALDVGDEVGARMAFRESYGRLTDAARAQRQPAAWSVSLGFDPQRREQAIDAAVAAGRLPLDHPHALPAPAAHARLTLVPPPGSAAAARERLQAMAEQLRAKPERPSVAQLEHERIRALKAETAQRVADRIATEAGGAA